MLVVYDSYHHIALEVHGITGGGALEIEWYGLEGRMRHQQNHVGLGIGPCSMVKPQLTR